MKDRPFKHLLVGNKPHRLWPFISISILLHAVFLQWVANLPVQPPATHHPPPSETVLEPDPAAPVSAGEKKSGSPVTTSGLHHDTQPQTGDIRVARVGAAGVTGVGLTGTVTDKGGEKIPGARIQVLHLGTGTRHSTLSDSGGRFEIPRLREGKYQVDIVSVGFRTAVRREILLPAGGFFSLTAQLIPLNVPSARSSSPSPGRDTPLINGMRIFHPVAMLWLRMKVLMGLGPSLTIHTGLQQLADAVWRLVACYRFLAAGLGYLF